MKLYITIILTALVLSFTACRGDGEPERPDLSDPDPLTLSFRMSTGVASRADDYHDETGSEYPWFEDRIDPQDLAVFIFVKKAGSSDDDEKLLLNTKAPHDSIDFYIDGAPGEYLVNMTVSRAYFADLLDTYISPTGAESLDFRVVLFANCTAQEADGKYAKPWTTLTSDETKDYKTLIETLQTKPLVNGSKWCYDMSWLYNANPVNNDITSIYDGRPIPMFGTNTFTATQKNLYNSSVERPLYLGSVDLLRAIAKVRVVDNIQDKGADGYPKVVGAEIYGTEDQAYQLPYEALTYKNGSQVHDPNIVSNRNALVPQPIQLGRLPDSWTMTPASERKGSTFAGFIPEQKIGYINNNVAESAPYFKISIAMYPDLDGLDAIQDFIVKMDDPELNYKGGFGDYILRNHIYTLSVDLKDAYIKATVDVLPYTAVVLNPSFGF